MLSLAHTLSVKNTEPSSCKRWHECWSQNPWRPAFLRPVYEPALIEHETICLIWWKWLHGSDHGTVWLWARDVDNPSADRFLQDNIGFWRIRSTPRRKFMYRKIIAFSNCCSLMDIRIWISQIISQNGCSHEPHFDHKQIKCPKESFGKLSEWASIRK